MTPHAILASAILAGPITNLFAIRSSLNNVTGVYAIYCVVTGHYYIGSSVNVSNRLSDYTQPAYQISRKTHPIIRALFKHGTENFYVLLLAKTTVSEIRSVEQSAIDLYTPAYNQLRFVDSSTGFKHTETTKDLLRVIKTGSIRSTDSREKQAETIKGTGNHRYGKKLTEKQKAHLRIVALARSKSHKPYQEVVVEYTETGVKNTYPSVRQAALHEPCPRLALTAVLKGHRFIHGLKVYYTVK